MVNKVVAEFSISYRQALDHTGKLVTENLPNFASDRDQLISMYRYMQLNRIFDTKAIALQRTGKLGTYPSTLGQEAIGVGIGSAMHKDDVFCPYYREYGTQLIRGVSIHEILLFWGGNEQGCNFKNNKHDLPFCIPIGSQTLHAAGAAFALKYQNKNRAVVVVIGDGGTSRGDFYEAVNLAGVWNLPVVFVVNNNQWAISVPLDKQTKTKTIAQKAIAGEVFAEQIDGNDVLMVRTAVQEALERACTGNGPTVIEALSYRMCDHTTADDASRYRSQKEYEEMAKKEPLKRMRSYLIDKFNWDEDSEQDLITECNNDVAREVEIYLDTSSQPKTAMFDYLYADLPASLQYQLEDIQ